MNTENSLMEPGITMQEMTVAVSECFSNDDPLILVKHCLHGVAYV